VGMLQWMAGGTATMVLVAGVSRAEVIFADDFEQEVRADVWFTYDHPDLCGPHKLEGWPHWENHSPGCFNPPGCDPEGEPDYCPCTSAYQVEAQPWWYCMQHDEDLSSCQGRKTVRLSVWQKDLFYVTGPVTDPADPQYHNHDQIQGWIMLMDSSGEPTATEYFLLGVHGHWASPEPTEDWWTYYAWCTASDGWHLTTVPRRYGWRHLEIVVHPYTGQVGDVEFFIDGQKVGQGSRLPGDGQGIPVSRIRLGADPDYISEDYIANSYQRFHYDDVELSILACDFDRDADVDLIDLATFQDCYSGDSAPSEPDACSNCDVNCDARIDLDDFGTFQAEYTGPGVR